MRTCVRGREDRRVAEAAASDQRVADAAEHTALYLADGLSSSGRTQELRTRSPKTAAAAGTMPSKAQRGPKTAPGRIKGPLRKDGKRKKATGSNIKAARSKVLIARTKDEVCNDSCSCSSIKSKLLALSYPSSVHQSSDSIVFVEQLAGLNQIKIDKVQLAVWRRAAVPSFVKSLSEPSVAAAGLPKFFGAVEPDAVARTMKEELLSQKKRALSDSCLDDLVKDVEQLVHIFAKICKIKTVVVKLEVLEDDGCAFWHQDSVPLRLVATYRGPCTEWVHPDFSKATLRRRQNDSTHAQSLSHLDVALFKGRGETREGGALLGHPGIVHRSPRINGSGIYRVVLVLDAPAWWHSA